MAFLNRNDRDSPRAGAAEGLGVAGEFAYAIPAGLVIALHLLVAIISLTGVVNTLARWGSGPSGTNLVLSLIGLVIAVAAVAIAAILWSRRSWLILLLPIVTVPLTFIGGMIYLSQNWAY